MKNLQIALSLFALVLVNLVFIGWALGLYSIGDLLGSKNSRSGQSFRCTQPLPEFTLGLQSKLSSVELSKLCACIWNKLGPADKEFSKAVLGGRRSDFSPQEVQKFSLRFGDSLRACGGMKL